MKKGTIKGKTKRSKTSSENPLTQPTPEIPEQPNEPTSQKQKPLQAPVVVEPPYSCKVMWVKGVVRVSVNLQRISEKCINFTPTTERFYLDTFKFTKKYKLDFPYPQGIRVDATAPEASLEGGYLTTDLKIVDWGDAAGQRSEIVNGHRSMLKERGIKGVDVDTKRKDPLFSAATAATAATKKAKKASTPAQVAANVSAPNPKMKAPKSSTPATIPSAEPTPTNPPKTKATTTPAKTKQAKAPVNAPSTANPAKVVTAANPPKPAAATAAAKANSPAAAKPAKAAKATKKAVPAPAPEDEDEQEVPVEAPKPRKKKFLEKAEMDAVLGQIVEAAERKSEVRLHRDEQEGENLEQVLQAKKEKQENRKKRKIEARQIVQKAIKRKSPKAAKPATTEAATSERRVMFA